MDLLTFRKGRMSDNDKKSCGPQVCIQPWISDRNVPKTADLPKAMAKRAQSEDYHLSLSIIIYLVIYYCYLVVARNQCETIILRRSSHFSSENNTYVETRNERNTKERDVSHTPWMHRLATPRGDVAPPPPVTGLPIVSKLLVSVLLLRSSSSIVHFVWRRRPLVVSPTSIVFSRV